ncbi:hypothetical protein QN360_09145 [Glaciimonas sp. CA11.2]|uniref:hypothetical protein n=1 Tax=Glaciimonas sp. CA11.2 TaxID=3048601 RepID=UPI002AB3FD28|nr:hypothetical protein [Glaciimonas sp. CA11.2]MDY7545505.1 hypothetical protein [Glaciimonas sp. CA11.2]MEB0163073.1 hypothetical protein [Glaciimonas sp. CA11.2]
MGRQRTINDTEFWRSPKMAGRTQEDRAVLFYLLTGPYSNIIGVYPIVPRIAASEMGWDSDSQLVPVLKRLAEAKFIEFDPESGFVWVHVWWDHNSAKMAVATTLRQNTFEQISQIPDEWRDDFVTDFVTRLPTRAQNKQGEVKNLRALIESELGIVNSHEDKVAIPYPYPIDREAGNVTTNGNSISNTTTNEKLDFPHALSVTEIHNVTTLLASLSLDMAQQLLDELAGVMAEGKKIKTSPVNYLHGLVKIYRAGTFVPAAGLRIGDRRKRSLLNSEIERSIDISPKVAHAHLEMSRAILSKPNTRN